MTTTTVDTALLTDTVKVAGKETIWVPAASMIPATTNGPASGQIETTTNDINLRILDFDASTDEFAHFSVSFPKSWDEGTITFQGFWSTDGAVTTGIALALQAVAIGDNVAIDTAYGTAIVVTDNAQSSAEELYVTSESASVTISNTPAIDNTIFFRLFRDVSDANDDMTEDMRLVGIKLFYTTDAGNDA